MIYERSAAKMVVAGQHFVEAQYQQSRITSLCSPVNLMQKGDNLGLKTGLTKEWNSSTISMEGRQATRRAGNSMIS